MTTDQYDNLVDIYGRVEQLRSLIILYTDTFTNSTDLDKTLLAVTARHDEYNTLGTLIFDLAHESYKRLGAALDEIGSRIFDRRAKIIELFANMPQAEQGATLAEVERIMNGKTATPTDQSRRDREAD